MHIIALRNLFQEKTRLIISVGGVAFSVVLIMILTGLYQGWRNKIGEYIRTIEANIWVMQSGSEELFHTPSVLPTKLTDQLKKIEGVDTVKPFNARRVAIHDRSGGDLNLYIVAMDTRNDVGQPSRVIQGKSLPDAGEIIIDYSQHKKVKLGEQIEIAKKQFKVVGFSEGGDLVTSSFAFIQSSEINKIQQLPNATNFFLVTVKPGYNQDSVITSIKSGIPEVDAVTKEKFVENNTKIVTDTFLPVILVLLVVAVTIGATIIGLIIFTSTIEKITEYGVLKAIGVKNSQLYTIVIQQALATGIIGYVIGSVVSLGLATILGQFVPQFVSQFSYSDAATVLALTLIMSIAAAYLPIRRVASIDPAEVFRT